MKNIRKNPSKFEILEIAKLSKHGAARMLKDEVTGDVWVWPFEEGDHRTGADFTGAKYSRLPGEGDVVFCD